MADENRSTGDVIPFPRRFVLRVADDAAKPMPASAEELIDEAEQASDADAVRQDKWTAPTVLRGVLDLLLGEDPEPRSNVAAAARALALLCVRMEAEAAGGSIDYGNSKASRDGLYLLDVDGRYALRRVQRSPDGTVKVWTGEAQDDAQQYRHSQLRVIGRVRGTLVDADFQRFMAKLQAG